MIDFWKYIRDYPYWERFKRDTYYFFRPVLNIRDTTKYFKSGNGNENDLDYSYTKYKNRKR